ncbi:hypothetical protein [Nonomuraea sp. NPDC049709]|uniref:hypothetical protein n=1 Tax=Nonomuraea sp. NPDC049709 TaxID=3154736 RepID=UPI00343EE68E
MLLKYGGDGHTVYLNGSRCVADTWWRGWRRRARRSVLASDDRWEREPLGLL